MGLIHSRNEAGSVVTPSQIHQVRNDKANLGIYKFNQEKEKLKKEFYKYVNKCFRSSKHPPLTYTYYYKIRYNYLTIDKITDLVVGFLREIYEKGGHGWTVVLYRLSSRPNDFKWRKHIRTHISTDKSAKKSLYYMIVLSADQMEIPADQRCVYKTPERLFRQETCVVCRDNHPELFYFPCAHHIVCRECDDRQIKSNLMNCPLCNRPVKSRLSEPYIPISDLIEQGLMDPQGIQPAVAEVVEAPVMQQAPALPAPGFYPQQAPVLGQFSLAQQMMVQPLPPQPSWPAPVVQIAEQDSNESSYSNSNSSYSSSSSNSNNNNDCNSSKDSNSSSDSNSDSSSDSSNNSSSDSNSDSDSSECSNDNSIIRNNINNSNNSEAGNNCAESSSSFSYKYVGRKTDTLKREGSISDEDLSSEIVISDIDYNMELSNSNSNSNINGNISSHRKHLVARKRPTIIKKRTTLRKSPKVELSRETYVSPHLVSNM